MIVPIVVIAGPESDTHVKISRAASEVGYRVMSVHTVREAAAIAEREDGGVAAVFCAVALPDGNWCDLLEALNLRNCAAPVVLCSREGSAEMWWDALERGIWEVMAPPVTVLGIQRMLAAWDEWISRPEIWLAVDSLRTTNCPPSVLRTKLAPARSGMPRVSK